MTSKGMNRDNAPRTVQSYILIPNSGNKLPERIESAQALRLVQTSAEQGDNEHALHKISDRIQGDHQLESEVRGYWMTSKGLLIHGTMDAAFRLSDVAEMKEPAAMEVPASNVTFLSNIREGFAGSVAHYTGHVRKQINNISNAFDGLAAATTVAAAPARYTSNEPKFALAA